MSTLESNAKDLMLFFFIVGGSKSLSNCFLNKHYVIKDEKRYQITQYF